MGKRGSGFGKGGKKWNETWAMEGYIIMISMNDSIKSVKSIQIMSVDRYMTHITCNCNTISMSYYSYR